jgi:hypothetical protein
MLKQPTQDSGQDGLGRSDEFLADRLDVQRAADALAAAFASNHSEAYFAAFSEDATFVFHSCDTLMPNLSAYRELWVSWHAMNTSR